MSVVVGGIVLNSATDVWILQGTGSPVGLAGANRGVSSLFLQSDGIGGPVLWTKIDVTAADWTVAGGGSATSDDVIAQQVFARRTRAVAAQRDANDTQDILAAQIFSPRVNVALQIAAALVGYLPLSGGTLTGVLNANAAVNVNAALTVTGGALTANGGAVVAGGFSTFGSSFSSLAGEIAYFGIVSPANITADQNDYPTTGASWLRLSLNANHNITGFLGGSIGRILMVTNLSAFNVTFTEQDAASTAANRFSTGQAGGLTLIPNYNAIFAYDNVSARWRPIVRYA